MSRILILLLLLIASSAAAVDYWPTGDGITFHYINGSGIMDTEITNPIYEGRILRADAIHQSSSGGNGLTCEIDGDGNVVVHEWTAYAAYYSEPELWWWDQPFVLLDFPLTVGKSWTTETTCHSQWDQSFDETVLVEVAAASQLQVPAGTFDVFEIRVTTSVVELTYWVNRDLGPVQVDPGGWQLVYWTGIVPSEASSWGDVKTLYR